MKYYINNDQIIIWKLYELHLRKQLANTSFPNKALEKQIKLIDY